MHFNERILFIPFFLNTLHCVEWVTFRSWLLINASKSEWINAMHGNDEMWEENLSKVNNRTISFTWRSHFFIHSVEIKFLYELYLFNVDSIQTIACLLRRKCFMVDLNANNWYLWNFHFCCSISKEHNDFQQRTDL